MRQVFLQKGAFVVKEVCQPAMGDYDVLVAVHYSFISSDTEDALLALAEQHKTTSPVSTKIKKVLESVASHGIDGTAALIKSKLKGESASLGYSCSGRVVATGRKVRGVQTGDFVACAGAGYAHHADLVCVPQHLVVRIPSECVKQASITTIGAIALQAVRHARLQLDEYVCVIGTSLVGQLVIQLARAAGCHVVAIDTSAQLLSFAQTSGAHMILNASRDNIEEDIAYLTHHHGVDATIVTTPGHDAWVQQGLSITRNRGKMVLIGDANMHVSAQEHGAKEIDIRLSSMYGPGYQDPDYEQLGQDYPYNYVRWTEHRNMQAFVRLIKDGAIDISSMVPAEIELEHITCAYQEVKQEGILGVFVTYEQQEDLAPLPKPKQTSCDLRFVPARKDVMRVGMIGAGGFARTELMPTISKLSNVKINGIADTHIASSLTHADAYGAAKVCTDYTDLFSEDVVDAVVIASPHVYHAEQAIDALTHAKAVFLERPMVTNWQQLHDMRALLRQYPNAPLCVDYNYAFAPFIQKIKKAVIKRSGPMMVHYRMNVGLVSKDHWLQTDIGAGRIIGEACQMLDLFCYLTDAQPIAVSVESVNSSDGHIFPTDNFVVQIRFDDGSVCSLFYTSIGNKKISRDFMEVFYDGKTIVMDDYLRLTGHGLYGFDEVVSTPDKGHEQIIKQFFTACTKTTFEPPIAYERLDCVAQLSLIIDALACDGGGSKDVTV